MNDVKPGSSLIDASSNKNKSATIKRKISRAVVSLSVFEKIAFLAAVIIALVTGYKLINLGYAAITLELPSSGGSIIEAATDFSRFINPVLARSDIDKDLTTLIFSGLLKPDENNILVNDLAESVEKSENNLSYTVTLKDGLTFQDNAPLTADDIIYTVQKIQDPTVKSPLSSNWAGVTVKKVDDKTIVFTLPQPYEPFIQNLTIGILPSHLWASTTADEFDINELNRKPIGSGPFKVASSRESAPGVISQYVLEPFKNYDAKKAYIGQYVFDMYKDEESAIKAVASGRADVVSGLSIDTFNENKDALIGRTSVYTPALPRLFALFFNQSMAPVLLNSEVRMALDQSIDRMDLLETVRGGYGNPTNSPIPSVYTTNRQTSKSSGSSTTSISSASSSQNITLSKEDHIALAQKTLIDNGWKKGEDGIFQKKTTLNKKTTNSRLAFTISTSNSPELKAISEYVAGIWKSVGADVSVQIYESADLSDKVVRPRKYDVLLFGQVIGRDFDLYPFWHSSQQKDIGLNLSMYANKKVDTALEKLRSVSSDADRQKLINTITMEMQNDRPAIFLYSPEYIFLMSHKVQGVDIKALDSGNERLYRVSEWYTSTRRILNSFQ